MSQNDQTKATDANGQEKKAVLSTPQSSDDSHRFGRKGGTFLPFEDWEAETPKHSGEYRNP
jgi:hypothetical protein